MGTSLERQARAEHELLAALSEYVDAMPHLAPPLPHVAKAMSLYHDVKRDQAVAEAGAMH